MERVEVGRVAVFREVENSKAQALKPLEEAAEVFGAWQRCAAQCALDGKHGGCVDCSPEYDGKSCWCPMFDALVDECCDVITATCNLLASLGVRDLSEAMRNCEYRNSERGRF